MICVCDLAVEAQIYRECLHVYPFVLGAQPVRPIDLASFYAAIANEGMRPTPHVVGSIERDGQVIYRHQQTASPIESIDKPAFYQLKTMLQGVLSRGTANAARGFGPLCGRQNGNFRTMRMMLFVGFTNDVTVAVWVGYDNADGKRRTLGAGATGGTVAVPIFKPIIQAVWADVVRETELAPPSADAAPKLTCRSTGRRTALSECFRVDADGKAINTRYAPLSGKGLEQDTKTNPSAQSKRDGETEKTLAPTQFYRAQPGKNFRTIKQPSGRIAGDVAPSTLPPKLDLERLRAAEVIKAADERIRKLNADLPGVLGGISPAGGLVANCLPGLLTFIVAGSFLGAQRAEQPPPLFLARRPAGLPPAAHANLCIWLNHVEQWFACPVSGGQNDYSPLDKI